MNWLLRVDGHADKLPLSGGQFASNWELSAQRAINVVKLLIAEGIPAEPAGGDRLRRVPAAGPRRHAAELRAQPAD